MFKIIVESCTHGSSKSFQGIRKGNRKAILVLGWIGFVLFGFSPLTPAVWSLFHENHLFLLAYFVILFIYCFVMVVLSRQYDTYGDL